MKSEKYPIYEIDPSDRKIINEIIDFENKSQELKQKLGIFAVDAFSKSMQMRKEKFFEMFPNHEIDEDWDKEFERRYFFTKDYEIFTLIKKEAK